jgi:hypothetical protein
MEQYSLTNVPQPENAPVALCSVPDVTNDTSPPNSAGQTVPVPVMSPVPEPYPPLAKSASRSNLTRWKEI